MNLHKFNSISEKLKSHQKLIAVSKGQDLEKIKQLYDIGHRDFGENFLQELKEKKAILPSDIRWHFLGNIQSNKVKGFLVFVLLVQDFLSQRGSKKNFLSFIIMSLEFTEAV